ncbi:hypothetical protein GW17_00022109 [Ensete ventricosum]|nr:hypothetical protein GW17_00022109 [Ensete ventricosum]
MGEVEYPSSLTYSAEELCISSVTLQRKLMKNNNCQMLIIGDQILLRVDCPLYFSIECQSKAGVMRTYLEVTTKRGRRINGQTF